MTNQQKLLTRLAQIIPNTQYKITEYHALTPDNILILLQQAGIGITWHDFQHWEDVDDLDIFQQTFKLPKHEQNYFISTDSTFNTPYQVEAIEYFIKTYQQKFGKCFYNGDIIVIGKDQPCLYMFHHEGLYSNILTTRQTNTKGITP